MKKILLILLAMGLLGGCQSTEKETAQPETNQEEGQEETEGKETEKEPYFFTAAGVEIVLPEGMAEACDAVVLEDGSVNFCLKESGDFVFCLTALPKEEKMEEDTWVHTLGETEDAVIQIMLPSCGTLNQEDVRPLWNEMVEKAGAMGEGNLRLCEAASS